MRFPLIIAIALVLPLISLGAPHDQVSIAGTAALLQQPPVASQYLSSNVSSVSAGSWNTSSVTLAYPSNNSTSISIATVSKPGYYIFNPGTETTGNSSILPAASPPPKGWITPEPLNGTIMNGTWNFEIGINTTYTTAPLWKAFLGVSVIQYNSTSGTYTNIFTNFSSTNVAAFATGSLTYVHFTYVESKQIDLGKNSYLMTQFILNVSGALLTPAHFSLYTGDTSKGYSSFSYPYYGWISGNVSPGNTSISINGTTENHAGNSFNLALSPGSYQFRAELAGYRNFSTEVVVVSDHVSLLNVTLKKLYTLNVSETGIPAGIPWNVTVSGKNYTSKNTTFSLNLTNGSYNYSFQNTVMSGKLTRYVNSSSNGTVNISGSSKAIMASYQEEYFLNLSVSPVSYGRATPSSGWYNSSSVVNISATPYTGHTFVFWAGSGNGSYSGTNASTSVTMRSPLNETAFFTKTGVKTYGVYFTESGLPPGTIWEASLNGTTESGNSTLIEFHEVNGSYSYSVAYVAGYSVRNDSGNISIAGSNQSIGVQFYRLTFSVTFLSTGLNLASGQTWSVMVNSLSNQSSNNITGFKLENGSYNYTVENVTGFSIMPQSGSFTVSGSNISFAITFTELSYHVIFIEKGLPNGTLWEVNLSGVIKQSRNDAITFNMHDASYVYAAFAANYSATNQNGTVTVFGSQISISLNFSHSSASPSSSARFPGNLLLILSIAAASAAAALLATYIYIRRVYGHTDDVYIVHNDGRLLKHFSTRMNPEIDQELFTATILAIKGALGEVTNAGDLKEIVIGKRRLEIFTGKTASLVLERNGKLSRSLDRKARTLVADINTTFEGKLENWGGDFSELGKLDLFSNRIRSL